MADWHTMCQAYCDYLYQDTSSGIKYSKEDTLFWQQKLVSLTYGEILYPSLIRFGEFIEIAPDDVLLDCGSGMGKACVQLFMQSWFKEIIGIEANRQLSNRASAVADKMKTECPTWFESNSLTLQHGNFLEYDNQEVTVMYSCSTCFSEGLMNRMGPWMDSFAKLKYILSLKPIPNLANFKLLNTKVVECSWDSSQCFIYGRHSS